MPTLGAALDIIGYNEMYAGLLTFSQLEAIMTFYNQAKLHTDERRNYSPTEQVPIVFTLDNPVDENTMCHYFVDATGVRHVLWENTLVYETFSEPEFVQRFGL